jgi:hypothetical protein
MYFFQTGELDAETLEIYRICAKLDNEDPVAILKKRGTGHVIDRAALKPVLGEV